MPYEEGCKTVTAKKFLRPVGNSPSDRHFTPRSLLFFKFRKKLLFSPISLIIAHFCRLSIAYPEFTENLLIKRGSTIAKRTSIWYNLFYRVKNRIAVLQEVHKWYFQVSFSYFSFSWSPTGFISLPER